MVEYIPNHVLADVLVRLPFKSLNRFRCVSKAWRDLIDSDYITGMHSARSSLIQTNPHPDSMVLELVDYKRLYTFNSVAKKGKGPYEVIPKQLCVDLPDKSRFVASCNGIICLSIEEWNDQDGDFKSCMALWNPITRTYFELPPLPDDFESHHPTKSEAFGYDHVNGDYKVVKWYRHGHMDDDRRIGCHRYDICVYSLKLNSWMTVKDGIPFEMPECHQFLRDFCTIANGAAHWLVNENLFSFEYLIVAFDLATYKFQKISCCIPYLDRGWTKMSCLNGCLWLVCIPNNPRRRKGRGRRSGIAERGIADIWVIEEYEDGNSLKMLASVELQKNEHMGGCVDPVAFIEKRGKLLLRVGGVYGEPRLALYDINKNSFSKVSIRGRSDCTLRKCVCGDGPKCSSRWSTTYCVCVGSFASPSSSS